MRTTHLESLKKKNLDTSHINYKVYHLLCSPEIYINSYGNICKNRGSTTLGIKGDEGYLLSFGKEKAQEIANKFKTNTYNWAPTRRTWIPKPGKNKLRPIDTPTQKDRIVQEAIRSILECIFEPEFKQFENQVGNVQRFGHYKVTNYGFRPGKSTFQALDNLKFSGRYTNIGIEGDIKGAYNNVDHDIMLKLISTRIKDKKFLTLMRNLLRSGVIENDRIETGELGTPQGGIVSPLLFNIYIFQLDKFILKQVILIESQNKHKKARVNPIYSKLTTQKKKLEDLIKSQPRSRERRILQKERRKVVARRSKVPYHLPQTKPKQAVYARYADDWLILFTGNENEATELREVIKNFIETELLLQLDEEKTLVTRLDNGIDFLGYEIKAWHKNQTRIIYTQLTKSQNQETEQKTFPKRTTSRQINILPSKTRLRSSLINKGFLDPETNQGKSARHLLDHSDYEIVQKYRYIVRGIVNYYKYCDNIQRLHFCLYVLQYSCLHTLAARHRITLKRAISIYGIYCTVTTTFERKTGPSPSSIYIPTLKRYKDSGFFSKKYKGQEIKAYDPFKLYYNYRTKLKTLVECCAGAVLMNK